MRERRSEHQRTDQEAERPAQVVAIPARCDLHADRIDAGKKEPRRKPRPKQQTHMLARQQGRRVARRAEQCARQERRARRIAVGNGKHGKHQRARDEAKLYRGGHVTERAVRQPQAALQIRQHGIAGKPQRGGGQLGHDDDGQDAARSLMHVCKLHEPHVACELAPRHALWPLAAGKIQEARLGDGAQFAVRIAHLARTGGDAPFPTPSMRPMAVSTPPLAPLRKFVVSDTVVLKRKLPGTVQKALHVRASNT